MAYKKDDATLERVKKMKIGIDLGGSHIAIGIVDENGKIVEKNEKRLTKEEKQDIKSSIVSYMISQICQFKQQYEIEAVGIGMPGYVENGIVMTSGNLQMGNYNLVEGLHEINLPIKIKNDAKCAALAEHAYGCLKGYDRSVFLTLGTGIGGAVFLNNQLLEAGKRPGYEFGHMVIERDGIPCHCGRKGCFERYASMKAFKDKLRKTLNLDETTRGEELLEIIRRNRPENDNYEKIENIVSEYIENLSIGIQNLICIFEPEVIGIGGSFVYFEDVFLGRLKQKLEALNGKDVIRKDIKIETAVLGNDAGMIGAVL